MTRRADVDASVALAVERFGRLDVVVNNAGIGSISRLDALRVEDWDAMLDVNLRGFEERTARVVLHYRQPMRHGRPRH